MSWSQLGAILGQAQRSQAGSNRKPLPLSSHPSLRTSPAVQGHLEDVLREHGSWFLQERDPVRTFAGLGNQGATCYLNSLVQTLFLTKVYALQPLPPLAQLGLPLYPEAGSPTFTVVLTASAGRRSFAM